MVMQIKLIVVVVVAIDSRNCVHSRVVIIRESQKDTSQVLPTLMDFVKRV